MGCPAYGLWPPTGIEPPNRLFSTDQLRLYTSNKQIRADMEELREFLCLVLRHSALSGKDLRHPALGADYGPKIVGGEPALFQEERNQLVRLRLRYGIRFLLEIVDQVREQFEERVFLRCQVSLASLHQGFDNREGAFVFLLRLDDLRNRSRQKSPIPLQIEVFNRCAHSFHSPSSYSSCVRICFMYTIWRG